MRGAVLRGAEVLRVQDGVPQGGGLGPAVFAHEEQLRLHQEEDLPTHTPAGPDRERVCVSLCVCLCVCVLVSSSEHFQLCK